MPELPMPLLRDSRRLSPVLAVLLGLLCLPAPRSFGFCGFYVAKADAKLWNQASQVVIARDGERTVMTMANDYRGELKEFAIVVPVPAVLTKDQVNVGDRQILAHLDAYTAPRLVEYFDPNPCQAEIAYRMAPTAAAQDGAGASRQEQRAKSLGVTIEASYTVGEYDILILSATQSSGLETWLKESGYRLPAGASRALAPYIKQDLKFFVAKVNLAEQAKTGFTYLRPLQMAYESRRFMLPIRLGMLNADGPQDLLVYTLTRNGRVESSNYRTVRIPTDVEVPTYVKDEFADFYRATFARTWEREGKNALVLEYFWDMGWCDPCAADPLSQDELRKLGVMWLGGSAASSPGRAVPMPRGGPDGAPNVVVTRLHVRYDGEHFPEDLMFQETADRTNFQGRYILRHPYQGPMECEAGARYRETLRTRHSQEAETLARLTGWSIDDIRRKLGSVPDAPEPDPWWKRIWQ